MSIYTRLLGLVLLSILFSCTKDEIDVSCSALASGVISLNNNTVEEHLTPLMGDLFPSPESDDGLGHANNLNILIQRLNAQCPDLTARLGCYACIYTLPAQSEIIIELDSVGVVVERVIDITTPKEDILTYASVHP